jgi:hypothetical protein
MLKISNIYGHGFNLQQLSQLEARGFRIRPEASKYIGSQICRFIDFQAGPSLECIEVESKEAYLAFVPKGMKPYCPGIALLLEEESPAAMEGYQQAFAELFPYPLHINYDGSADQGKPGWNYLNFGIPVVPDTFIWLTELEEPRPANTHRTDHPNGVMGVRGFVFDLGAEKLNQFLKLVRGRFATGSFHMGEQEIWLKNTLQDFPDGPDKTFPLTAIVLKTEKFDFFKKPMDGVKKISFKSRPAVYIETNRLCWDILITS